MFQLFLFHLLAFLPMAENVGTTRVLNSLRALFLCALYMISGPSLIVVNKQLMSDGNFPYPMCLSSLGVLSSALVARAVVGFGWGEIRATNASALSGRAAYLRRVVPVGLFYALTLGLGNACYLYLDVGFIQMLKAFTPVVILAVLAVSKVETPTRAAVASILVISVGTAVSN